MAKLSVVIVTWNSEKEIKTCLESLINQSFNDFRVIVVDNNSSDETLRIIKKDYPIVETISLKKNLFLTGGNNIGIKRALDKHKAEFIMVLNPDTKLESNTIANLLETLGKNPKFGAVGPKAKFFNNKNEGRINSAGLIYDGFMQAYDRGFMDNDQGQFDGVEEVFGVSGVCIIYKSALLKEVGLYWEKIKMYLDEVELFIRVKKTKWKVIYDGNTTIYHSYMSSSNSNKSLDIQKQKLKAWLLIALRHYPLKSKIAVLRKYVSFKISQL